MKIIRIIHIVLALISGALLIGYGEMDDSPGAQGIGLLTVVCSVLISAHLVLKRSDRD